MSNQPNTFWELITKHKIEIPIIQRDYAQGRRDKKSQEIRENFISQIKYSLDAEDKPMHLNFIYGKIHGKVNAEKLKENKEAVNSMLAAVKTYSRNLEPDLEIECHIKEELTEQNENNLTSFVPLDGQQRLTTLFLLHWYLMPNTNENKEILSKFTYKIRPGSKDFCKALVKNKINLETLNGSDLKSYIMDSSWFFDVWKYDPTVRGMLRMLNQIQDEFGTDNLDNYWKRLIEEKAISFEFLDLDTYKLTDRLYIKMNARGVPLTNFENFKAWLIEYIQKKKLNLDKYLNRDGQERSWNELLDTDWTDLFWINKDDDNMLIDEEMMRYFRNMMQIFLVRQDSFKPETDSKKDADDPQNLAAKEFRDIASILATDTDKETNEYVYISNNFYNENNLLTEKNLNNLFASIHYLTNGFSQLTTVIDALKNANIVFWGDNGENLFREFIKRNSTYPDKVQFYALYAFLRESQTSEDQLDVGALCSWMRVIRNLVENSTIDSIPAFKRAIVSIDKLVESYQNIITYLSLAPKLGGFDRDQIQEEIRKSKLIHANRSLESLILRYENNVYFKGQINFLFDLVNSQYHKIDVDLFTDYADKMSNIFEQKYKEYHTKGEQENLLFERALLTKSNEELSDYMIRVDSNYSFAALYPLDRKKTTWKKDVFNHSERLKLIKLVLDDIKVGDETAGLEKICLNYKESDWKFQLCNTPYAIRYCWQRLIRYENEHDIKLLNHAATFGYHAELFSFCLDQKIRKESDKGSIDISPIIIEDYHSVKSASHKAHGKYSLELNSIEYELHIHYDNENNEFLVNPYELKFFIVDEDRNFEKNYQSQIKNILTESGFEWKNEDNVKGYWTSVKKDDEAIVVIGLITQKFREL